MTERFSMVRLIERKKLGGRHTPEELDWICREFVAKAIPDYQVAAWLMAVRLRGMASDETLALTRAIVATGETLEWPADRPVVDKHSTGGVGDKTSIALVPLLAAAGLTFVKMSGRGLGYTGGTLDKLESIPGFRVDLPLSQIREQADRIGCALVGQTAELAPADGVLYALRDVTSTVDAMPLIASSVMSKKLAAGARAIVLDVKYGSGAFMESFEAAEALARAMVDIGTGAGRRVRAVLSPMDEPLGRAVGNALEVKEAIETLRGEGPADLTELTIELGAQLMVLSGATPSLDDARVALQRLLSSGVGLRKLEELIEAQGGDPAVVRDPARLPSAPRVVTVTAEREGWVERFDARGVAEAALALGAGRRKKGDVIDPRTGVCLLVREGETVQRGQPVAELHADSADDEMAAREALRRALRISEDEPARPNRPRSVVHPFSSSSGEGRSSRS